MASEQIHFEIYLGEDLCKQKFHDLWEELSLPKVDIEEMGHHRSSGFVWLKQKKKKKKEHKFKSIGKTIIYDAELTMFIERGRIKKLTGCANKEMFLRIYFKSLHRTPVLIHLNYYRCSFNNESVESTEGTSLVYYFNATQNQINAFNH